MKTSNKILLFIGIALLISPFINAYSLKQKLRNNEYTLLNIKNKSATELIDITPTDSVHIIGGDDLTVEIVQSDSISVEKSKDSDVSIYEKDGVLTVQYFNENGTNSQHPGVVTIKTPSIKVISFEGKLIVDSVGNKYKNTVTRHYPFFEVTVKGFKADQLGIQGLNGGGRLTLANNHIKDLSLHIGELSSVKIDSTNHFDLLNVQSSKNPSITLDGTHVKSLKTNLGTNASLTLKGNNIENITNYK